MPSLDILSLGATQHRTTAMGTFERMLSYIQPRVLRDLIKIIRLEQVRVPVRTRQAIDDLSPPWRISRKIVCPYCHLES